MPHAGIDAFLTELHAAPVDILVMDEMGEQLAVAAADIEDARSRIDHAGDEAQILANVVRRRCRRGGVAQIGGHGRSRPRCWAQPSRKPRKVAKNSGSSSRNASCPLSVSTSTKLTLAAIALSAWTIARLSLVGYSQTIMKQMTQNSLREPQTAMA